MAKSSPSASKSIFPTDTRIWTSKLLARPPQTRLQPVPGRRQMERLPSPLFPQDHTLFMPNTKADMPSRTGFSRSIWSLEKQISLTFHKPTLPKSSTASKRKIPPPLPAKSHPLVACQRRQYAPLRASNSSPLPSSTNLPFSKTKIRSAR